MSGVFESPIDRAQRLKHEARMKYEAHFESSYRVKPQSRRVARRRLGLSARQFRMRAKRARRLAR